MVRLLHLTVLSAFLGVSSCISGDDPAGPGSGQEFEAVIYSGDGQFGEPGTELADPLEVIVRRIDGEELEEGIRVQWEVVEGEGASLSRISGFTDGSQRARTRLTLGSRPGIHRVRARFPDHGLQPLEFGARAAVRPVATSVEPSSAGPGEVVVIEGDHFISEHAEMIILFDGIRAETVSGSTTSVSARVPPCLSSGVSRVTVALGALVSESVSMEVEAPGAPISLPVGGVHTIEDPSARSCTHLSGSTGSRFLAVVHSTGTVGVVLHPYTLAVQAGSTEESEAAGAAETMGAAPEATGGDFGYPGRRHSAQTAWEATVRMREADAIREAFEDGALRGEGAPAGASSSASRAEAVPTVGDHRTFNVLNAQGEFTAVDATARFVGEHSVLYVDLEAPEGGFSSDDLELLGREFDEAIHPTVREAYGRESDLDGNGRVVILFTPVVNQLTPSGSNGFVGGFFFGVDLLPGHSGSNRGEIFYALVPDPQGEFGKARSLDRVLTGVPAILAHEFQHMVHFNERILVRMADRAEAVWLSEALATTAEHLVGNAYRSWGDESRAHLFWSGNHARALRFLEDPSSVGLLIGVGSGTIEERGAGWLFMTHILGRFPRSDGSRGILTDLTQSTRTGTQNVTAVVGESWSGLVRPWTLALFLDGLGVDVDSRYEFSILDLRGDVAAIAGYPLVPRDMGDRSEVVVGSLPSSSARFFLLQPPAGGLAVNLAGPEGGDLSSRAALGLSLVRLE